MVRKQSDTKLTTDSDPILLLSRIQLWKKNKFVVTTLVLRFASISHRRLAKWWAFWVLFVRLATYSQISPVDCVVDHKLLISDQVLSVYMHTFNFIRYIISWYVKEIPYLKRESVSGPYFPTRPIILAYSSESGFITLLVKLEKISLFICRNSTEEILRHNNCNDCNVLSYLHISDIKSLYIKTWSFAPRSVFRV